MMQPLPCHLLKVEGVMLETPEPVTLLSIDAKTRQAVIIREDMNIEIHPFNSIRLKSILRFGVALAPGNILDASQLPPSMRKLS